MNFKRFRHKRINKNTRAKYQETLLHKSNLIWPVFLVNGQNIKQEIQSMPDVFHFSSDILIRELDSLVKSGLNLFCCLVFLKKKASNRLIPKTGLFKKLFLKLKKHSRNLKLLPMFVFAHLQKTAIVISAITMPHVKF